MAHAYRRIRQEAPQKLKEWNEAIRVLQKGDHYILVFWHQPKSRSLSSGWRLKALIIVGTLSAYLLFGFLFGRGGSLRRGELAPIDKYIPSLSPVAEHVLQLFFLLIVVLAFFPKLTSRFLDLLLLLGGGKSQLRKLK